MGKKATILAALMLAIYVSSTITFPAIAQTISTPPVPEFSLSVSNHYSETPTTNTTNPYTGQNFTQSGYEVEWQSIDVTITNKPLSPFTSSGHTIEILFNVRLKGHFENTWEEQFTPDNYPTQNYMNRSTTISILEGENATIMFPDSKVFQFPAGGQIDFEVEALLGYTYRDENTGIFTFTGNSSGWSNTQTIAIPQPAPSETPTSAPTFTPTPTLTLSPIVTPTPAQVIVQSVPAWFYIIISSLVAIIAVLLGVIATLVRRKQKPNP